MTTGLEQWKEEFPSYYSRPAIIARNPHAVIALAQVECYSRSCVLHIIAAARRLDDGDALWPAVGGRFPAFSALRRPPDDSSTRIRFGVRFSDGTALSLVPGDHDDLFPDAPENNHHKLTYLAQGTATDSPKVVRAHIELSPLPGEPHLDLGVSWPFFQLAPHRITLPAAELHAAAGQAQNHWT